ncbi:putative ATP-dependent RNA helicase kurz [Halotydeus destructor]|nr:putative ATP-dependent RNA helicase kurz [Halotydeus destructor]
MAKNKKKFNHLARQGTAKPKRPVKKTASSEATEHVEVEFEVDDTKFDDSNALIINESAKSKRPRADEKLKTVLSKKEVKRLKKVIERKEKKVNRVELLNDLQQYQLKDDEYLAMSSASGMQTRGLKRIHQDTADGNTEPTGHNQKKNKRRGVIFETGVQSEGTARDLNVVSFDASQVSGSSEDDDENSDDEVNHDDISAVPAEAETVKTDSTSIKPVEPTATEISPEPIEPALTLPTYNIVIHRTLEIEEIREKLPIIAEEQAIVEAIRYNNVVVICGETGSGKTTQVPQFLFEAGYARESMIGITEPRRVAAVAMASRVGEELNLAEQVSYQIRYEHNVTENTKVKFMTDGVLLREVQKDFMLTNYSVLIIDEAHERSVFSDVLIGLLSRIIKLREKRKPVKLVIMSATLRVSDFTENKKLFNLVPPVIQINVRQYPVAVHFSKTTPEDYMKAAFSKICKVHRDQPAGAILVFVTGKQEVVQLIRKLRQAFPYTSRSANMQPVPAKKGEEKPGRRRKETETPAKSKSLTDLLPTINLDDYKDDAGFADDGESDIEDEDLDSDSSDEEGDNIRNGTPAQPLYCLPLYSGLPKNKQSDVFKSAPEGARLCIVSTNIAETSLTIPGIKYVVDTGKVKAKVYDKTTGISTFVIEWCSKASSDQRAGRSGRTSAGTCYRLFSSAVYKDQFSAFSEPEISKKPVEELFLQLKALDIDNVHNFPFPTPPSSEALQAAESRLVTLGALEPESRKLPSRNGMTKMKLTPLGKVMSKFPLSPRYSKMLSVAYPEIQSYIIAITSAFTVQEVFLSHVDTNKSFEASDEALVKLNKRKAEWFKLRQKWSGAGNERLLGDATVLLKAIGSSEFAGYTAAFCERNGLRHKAIVEVHKLRKQLTNEVNALHKSKTIDDKLTPPSDLQSKHLRQVLLTGFCDHVARRIPNHEKDMRDKTMKNAYTSVEVEGPVFIDSSSILKDNPPEFVVYQEIHESTKMFMRNVIAVEPEWLAVYAESLCTLSKPLEEPEPFYDGDTDDVKCHRNATFGPHAWHLPVSVCSFPGGLERCRWFARFLLEGKVHPWFATRAGKLLTSPSILNKPWAKLQPRTSTFVNALAIEDVDSMCKLRSQWAKHPKYLLKEYLDWVPSDMHRTIETDWLKIVSTVDAE